MNGRLVSLRSRRAAIRDWMLHRSSSHTHNGTLTLRRPKGPTRIQARHATTLGDTCSGRSPKDPLRSPPSAVTQQSVQTPPSALAHCPHERTAQGRNRYTHNGTLTLRRPKGPTRIQGKRGMLPHSVTHAREGPLRTP